MSSSVEEILAAARAQDVALVGEVCGYLVLGAADAVLETRSHPAPELIRIHDDGNVEVGGERTSEAAAERALREILGLLLAAVRTPFPNLSRVADRPDARGLASLVTELEAALVPVNRRAARRSLSRLSREARRAVERGLVVPRVSLAPDEILESEVVTSRIASVFEPSIPPGLEGDFGVGESSEPEGAPDTQRFSEEIDPFDDEPTVVVADVSESLTDLVAEIVASSQGGEDPTEFEPFDISIDVDFGPDEGLGEPDPADSLWPEPAAAEPADSLWPEPAAAEPAPLDSLWPEPVPLDPAPLDSLWPKPARSGSTGVDAPSREPAPPEPVLVEPRPASTKPPLRPGSDRYRTVRPRSDVPPKNPTPLIPPSEGGSARPSELEGLLSAMKPRVQPDQLQQALDGLTLGSGQSGDG